MMQSTLRVRLTEDPWIAAVSRSDPAATFELLAGVPAEPRAIELGRFHADDPDRVLDTIESHDAIVGLEVLFADD